MPKRPPTGFNVRRAQQQRIDWDNPQPQPEEPAAPTPQSRPVGEVARHIKSQLKLDPELNDVWIEGEVRSFNRSGAGHYYFDLADSRTDSALACAFFRRDNRGMPVQQGDQVLVHGSADIYLPRGSLQIIVDDLRPVGEGVLQAEFERLRRKLDEEGLFNPDRRLPLPRYPKRIGVVTSPSGAVWHDIQQVLARRWPLSSLVLSPCLTQGAGAPESIQIAIGRLNDEKNQKPDVIIVARGGGSPEDLWAYNEEQVARAIHRSKIPVISAIGHETDVSIADHVADRRAPTPSAAAEIAVPDRAEEAARVAGIREALYKFVDNNIVELELRAKSRTDRLQRLAPHPPTMRVELTRRSRELDQAIERQLALLRAHQSAGLSRLSALNPLSTLERGYAIVSDESGQVVTEAAGLDPGQPISIRFADGDVAARTTSDPHPAEERQHAG